MTQKERLVELLKNTIKPICFPNLQTWFDAAEGLADYLLSNGVIVPPCNVSDKVQKRVLDPCCGSKMFWFDRENPDVEFCDIRQADDEVIWRSKNDGRERRITVHPDIICDVTALPFDDNTFWHVVFDPPHLLRAGDNSWLCEKYGKLSDDWKSFIRDGFSECMRCLRPNGTLIFKWNETDISLKDVLSVIPYKPLYGHRSGKQMKTHWIAFIKDREEAEQALKEQEHETGV